MKNALTVFKEVSERRFVRLLTLLTVVQQLVPDLQAQSLRDVLCSLTDWNALTQWTILLAPETGMWIRILEHHAKNWMPLPSRKAAVRRHIDKFWTLLLLGLERIRVRVPANSVCVFPLHGFCVALPIEYAGKTVDVKRGETGILVHLNSGTVLVPPLTGGSTAYGTWL